MKANIITLLENAAAILKNDHFVLTSGKHSPLYINKDAAYTFPETSSKIGKLFAETANQYPVDIVAAPALGGIILSQWTAYHLGRLLMKPVYSVYTEKTQEKNQIFTRGYDIIVRGKNVLVIEDLTTTGGSVVKVLKSVRDAGGNVTAVGVMVNRNPDEVKESLFAAPFFSLAELPVETYEPDQCPLCKKKIPINTKVGHGIKFLESMKK